MHGRHEKFTQDLKLNNCRKDITERYHLEDRGADVRIILK